MKKIILVLALAFATVQTYSQRTWFDAEFSAEIFKNLDLSISPEVRFKEEFELKEYFIQPSLEYKFSKYFRLGAGYRFGYDINKNDEHESFGRFHVDAKTGFKWNNFNPKFRLRYTDADDFADDNDEAHYLRYKLELEYNLKKLNLEPNVLYEWYQNLDEKEFTKSRFEVGMMYKINKHHKIGAYFRTNNYLNSDKETIEIIGMSYKFSL